MGKKLVLCVIWAFQLHPELGVGRFPTWEAAWRLNSWVNNTVLAQKWGSAEGLPFFCRFWYSMSRHVMGGGGGGVGDTAVAAGGHQVQPCILYLHIESDQNTQTRMWVEEGVYNNKQTPSAVTASVWVNIDLHRRSRRPGHRTDLRDCRCCRLCLRLQLLVLRLLWSLLWDVWIWRPTNTKEHSRSRTSIDIR